MRRMVRPGDGDLEVGTRNEIRQQGGQRAVTRYNFKIKNNTDQAFTSGLNLHIDNSTRLAVVCEGHFEFVIKTGLRGPRSRVIMVELVAPEGPAPFNSTQPRRRPCPLLHAARCRRACPPPPRLIRPVGPAPIAINNN